MRYNFHGPSVRGGGENGLQFSTGQYSRVELRQKKTLRVFRQSYIKAKSKFWFSSHFRKY